ncbi:aldose 1-epimerase [Parabacteroides chinchillae]|uniref:Aldose 1-epimerase n=2 Tax=Parabacteroides chinchillae TaxID=871327 RepID=A0A8G2F3T2_9BACT|nr:aldose 1-epimerase [Parabacteroides chinchillae]
MMGIQDGQARHSRLGRADFQAKVDGKQTDLYYLTNKNGVEIAVTNFGGRVVEIWAPDKNGQFADIVLGHDNVNAYANYKGERFLGATIGRYGNRIDKGQFTLDGKDYQLPINDKPNSLHGGDKGFDMVVWDADQTNPQTLVLSYVSKDGEQGYPGTMKVKMTYHLSNDNEFVITHEATTDKNTVINLTHHSFFNLHGAGNGTINDHVLMLNADKFTPVNNVLIPTGELTDVTDTPMDFRKATPIGERVDNNFEQLAFGHGYDHNWVLKRKTANELELAASVHEPVSGRYMEVWTTEPGIQFYGGNFFDGSMIGKRGQKYNYRASLALETQHFPDSPNHPNFPSTVLKPGEQYKHICVYKFGVK